MSPAGIRKAALLLMSLDPPTAAELLKAAEPEVVTEIAAELAYLQASGGAVAPAPGDQPVREFFSHLRQRLADTKGNDFLENVLRGALGPERSRDILGRISELVERRDPFMAIRSAEPEDIAEALNGESPHVAGLVLSELPAKVSSKVLPLLGDDVRAEAVRGMTQEEAVSPQTRLRVATVVRKRLTRTQVGEAAAPAKVGREKQLRKVAVLLRSLSGDLRNTLLEGIVQADPEAGAEVRRLMVVWEDLPVVSDRSLQEGLRSVDAQTLALAMVDADETTVSKLRSNMSQRQAMLLDEEASLLGKPSQEDVDNARNEFLDALRQLGSNNLLTFEEEPQT